MKSRKKTAVLVYALLGLLALALLVITRPAEHATATEPTPTPTITPVPSPLGEPGDTPCRLELGMSCDFSSLTDVTISELRPRTNPSVGARGVPTYTLVSVTFDRDMDPSTIGSDTFYVSQGVERLSGSLDYLTISKMAVFYPDPPLLPNTTYTATVTTGVQDLSGKPLAEDIVWTFTTSSGALSLGDGMTTTGASSAGSGMNVYFGDLHSHSGYSDGQGTPADAFDTAQANGLDFFALTDHAFMLTDTEWQDTLAQAEAATEGGEFVGLAGFEFTHIKGHINVFNTDTYVHRNDPSYQNLEDFYSWLTAQPTAIGQFNHPTVDEQVDWNFNDFAFYPAVDQKIVLRDLSTPEQFFLSLNAGWHLGTLFNSDTHQANWGAQRFMGLVAPNLTKEAILEGLRARRTFFVSPSGQNFALVMQANGHWMGSAIPEATWANFTITAHDPDRLGSSLKLALYDNGVRVANTTLPGTDLYTWTPKVRGKLGHYYYAEAYYDGWLYPAYSSPIWVERPPVAEAGVSQTVVPGTLVTLDGSESWDPDGDALAYQWTQESGAEVSLSEAHAAQPTFIAPDVAGDIVFRLTVVDTGSLSDSDTTIGTVTDDPVLSITKSGPATAEPDELITYTLTVTNSGITTATEVIITDAVPAGATYISGGTLMPGNIVSWTVPGLAASGGATQATFVVTTTEAIANADYGVSSAEGASARGRVIVFTNARKIYLPVMLKVP